ncbi:MAG: three-Cys-motif partner protein TcmP [Agitococcus sp.]|nr:three-Cys-motif partner protein TcmP [Agitococcus sp.]
MAYNWKNGPADLKQHSLAKHRVLQAYLAEYFKKLCANRNRDEFKVTLVDAFAGGGVYNGPDGKLMPGSPLILLNAVKEADFHLNSSRTKKLNLDVSYFFVDKDKAAINFLTETLKNNGYCDALNKSIHIYNDNFLNQADNIIKKIISKSPRNGRSIFILDQYGYNQVPMDLIAKILKELPSSEIILTFAVDSLLNFLTEKNDQSKKILASINLSDVVVHEMLKNGSSGQQRLLLQSTLYHEIVGKTKAKYYTPFYIRTQNGHGDFWLLHLSQHHRARDVMTSVHWKNHNDFIHYGGAGIGMFDMLGYDQYVDTTVNGSYQQPAFGFEFDARAKEKSIAALSEDLIRHIYADDEGITLGELYASTCNLTPATSEIYKEAVALLSVSKEVDVIGTKGEFRKKGSSKIHDKDVLKPSKQINFSFNRP